MTQRLSLGAMTRVWLAEEEKRLGRAMTEEEVDAVAGKLAEIEALAVDAAAEEAAASSKTESPTPQEIEEVDYEAEIEVLDAELGTGPSSAREFTLKLEEPLRISDDDDESSLTLSPPASRVWIQISTAPDQLDDDDVEVILETWQDGGPRIAQVRSSDSLVDFYNIREALDWKEQSPEWQEAFSRNVLLPPTRAICDSQICFAFPISGRHFTFLGNSTTLTVTLACPEPGGPVWCRIYGLYHMAWDEALEDFDEYKIQEQFCFPISLERLLAGDYPDLE